MKKSLIFLERFSIFLFFKMHPFVSMKMACASKMHFTYIFKLSVSHDPVYCLYLFHKQCLSFVSFFLFQLSVCSFLVLF
jgi:hypothetical protein